MSAEVYKFTLLQNFILKIRHTPSVKIGIYASSVHCSIGEDTEINLDFIFLQKIFFYPIQ